MPYNRVNNIKSTIMWLLILNDGSEREPGNLQEIEVKEVPTYIPGFMLIPIPNTGFILGHIDWAFWAVFGYVLGSVAYVIDSFYLWGLVVPIQNDDSASPENYWNTIASWLFLLNALTCILDWWLQERQLSLCNMFVDGATTGGLKVEEIPTKISMYYFYNNLFFLGAAVVFIIQSLWMENIQTDLLGCSATFCGSFWMNFWGNTLYLFSSAFAVLEYFENVKEREMYKLPPLKFISCQFREVDWFGWGDWLYFLISIMSVFQSFLQTYIRDDDSLIAPYYLTVNWLFLFDSIAYMIGYMLFVYDLRQALVTGMVSENCTGMINAMIGDNYEEYEEDVEKERETALGKPSMISSRGSVFRRDTSATGSSASSGIGRVSIVDIKRRLAEAQQIRIRKTVDFRQQLEAGGSVTIFTPIVRQESNPLHGRSDTLSGRRDSAGNPTIELRERTRSSF